MSNPPSPSDQSYTYADAGVSIAAGNALVRAIGPLAKATRRPGADAELGGFGGMFDLKAAGFTDPLLVAANDGVGTKLKLAIEWDRHEGVGVDLVAMCANDLIVQGAEPLFFLDYYATAKLDNAIAERVVASIAEGCRQAGCALIGGETAEMPGMYAKDDYDLAGFSVGAAERGQLLPRPDVRPGDVLLGLASSGVHSNGFSLVRRILDAAGLDHTAPAPFAPGTTLGQELLEPTRIYVKSVLALHKARILKAAAHITGGGIVGNLPRVLPAGTVGVVDATSWNPGPVFGWLAEAGGVAPEEMLRVFNCGIGMILVVAPEEVETAIALLTGEGEQVSRIGHIAAGTEGAEPVVDVQNLSPRWPVA